MISRATFVELLAASLFPAVASAAAPSPAPTGATHPWDLCDPAPVLPYDRPILLKMQTLDGPDFELLHLRGRIVLLNVFATWCGPCRAEQPALQAAAHTYADRGLYVVGINAHEPDDAVRAYRKTFEIDYPIAMDRNRIVTANMELGAGQATMFVPASFFITRTGYLSCYKRGSMSAAELAYRIEAMFSDDEPATPAPAASPR